MSAENSDYEIVRPTPGAGFVDGCPTCMAAKRANFAIECAYHRMPDRCAKHPNESVAPWGCSVCVFGESLPGRIERLERGFCLLVEAVEANRAGYVTHGFLAELAVMRDEIKEGLGDG